MDVTVSKYVVVVGVALSVVSPPLLSLLPSSSRRARPPSALFDGVVGSTNSSDVIEDDPAIAIVYFSCCVVLEEQPSTISNVTITFGCFSVPRPGHKAYAKLPKTIDPVPSASENVFTAALCTPFTATRIVAPGA